MDFPPDGIRDWAEGMGIESWDDLFWILSSESSAREKGGEAVAEAWKTSRLQQKPRLGYAFGVVTREAAAENAKKEEKKVKTPVPASTGLTERQLRPLLKRRRTVGESRQHLNDQRNLMASKAIAMALSWEPWGQINQEIRDSPGSRELIVTKWQRRIQEFGHQGVSACLRARLRWEKWCAAASECPNKPREAAFAEFLHSEASKGPTVPTTLWNQMAWLHSNLGADFCPRKSEKPRRRWGTAGKRTKAAIPVEPFLTTTRWLPSAKGAAVTQICTEAPVLHTSS